MSLLRRLRNWLDERFGWDSLIAPLRKKTVPLHRLSYWYFLGGMTLFLFIIQVITGILLLLYYRPGANEAFESVQYIMTRVQFGWLIRSIHSWSANLMIFTAFAHMFSVLFPQGVPQTARTHLDQRRHPAVSGDGIRIQRLPVALEHAGVLSPPR